MGFVLQAILPLVPVEQSLQDGWQAVLSKRTHRVNQLDMTGRRDGAKRQRERMAKRLVLFKICDSVYSMCPHETHTPGQTVGLLLSAEICLVASPAR